MKKLSGSIPAFKKRKQEISNAGSRSPQNTVKMAQAIWLTMPGGSMMYTAQTYEFFNVPTITKLASFSQ